MRTDFAVAGRYPRLSSGTDHERAGLARQTMYRIAQCEQELEIVISHTEAAFISIGGLLGDFQGRARKVSEMSSAITAGMTGGEIIRAVDDLNGLLERMEAYLRISEEETRADLAKLSDIMGLMKRIYEPLEDFRRITKTLRSLDVTARVQYSSLMIKNVELKVLLDDIKKLSEVMTAKSNDIRRDLKSLETLITQTISRLLVFKEAYQGRARTVLDRTMAVLCSVTEQYGLSAKVTSAISDTSAAVSWSTREIVTSIQFHDITRQQFERARKTLRDLQAKCRQHADGELMEEGSGPAADTLSDVAGLCKQEASLLSATGDTFAKAVRAIIDNLRNISLNVATMSADTQKILGRRADRKTFLTETEGLLSSVTASFKTLSENADAGGELSRTLLSLTGATAQMGSFAGQIEEIAEDVQLIAFNTEIKSAQIGREGTAFGIVAESIQRLSSETSTQVRVVSEVLNGVTSAAADLSVCKDKRLSGQVDGFAGIASDFESLIATFSRLNGNIVSVFAEIEKEEQVLSSDIESIVTGIDVHSMVDRVVRRIVSLLNAAASQTGTFFPDGEEATDRNNRITAIFRGGDSEGKDTYDGVEFF